jgi:hypothetical protein
MSLVRSSEGHGHLHVLGVMELDVSLEGLEQSCSVYVHLFLLIEGLGTSDVCRETLCVVINATGLPYGCQVPKQIMAGRRAEALVDTSGKICPIRHCPILQETYVPLFAPRVKG